MIPISQVEGCNGSGHFEGVVDSTASRSADPVGGLAVARVHGDGRAEVSGERQPVLGQVDRDELTRSRRRGTEQRGQPDPAETNDGYGRPGFDSGGVHDRTDPGQHGTAEQSRLVERQVRIDLDQRATGDGGVFSERRDAEVVIDCGSVAPMQATRSRKQRTRGIRHRAGFAQCRTAFRARLAVAARRNEYQHDMIARLQLRAAAPALEPSDLFDHTGRLMP